MTDKQTTQSLPQQEHTNTVIKPPSVTPADFDPILEKLKLLEFGLYGLQQYRRSSGLDDEDIGPFYRLAEEIGSDLLELQRRLNVSGEPQVDK